jgi:hypothetical protein
MKIERKITIFFLSLLITVILTTCGGGGGDEGGVPVTMNLSVTVKSPVEIDLTWTPYAGGVIGYDIDRNGSAAWPYHVSGTWFPDTGLLPATLYCYTVYAVVFPFGALGKSNVVCAVTLPNSPPTTPTNVNAVAVSPARIDLKWDASTDDYAVSKYNIYKDGTYFQSVSTTFFSDVGLDPARQFCYTISAADAMGGESAKSSAVCANTSPDTSAPTAPTGVIAGVTSNDKIGIIWTAATDDGVVRGYRIFRDGALIGTTTDIQLTDSGLSAETQYCYTIQAFDAAGNQSAPSGQACATTSWKYATLDSNVDVQWTAIALDVNDKLYIAYYDGRYTGSNQQVGTVNYTTNLSGTWQSTVVDSVAPTVYGSLSLLVNTDGSLHIAYYDFYQNYRLRHAMKTSGAWVTESIASNAINVTTVAMVHDAAGNLHLVFNPNGSVTYMTNASGAWTSNVIGNNGVIYGDAATCAIAVDAAGKAYIGYYDYTNHVLKYVTNASGSWVTDTVDGVTDVGLYTAIAVDAGGKTHLSYYDVTNGDLKYATNATGYWVTQTVDSIGDVGPSTAIALDANGHAHISYTDATNHSLKYATNASGLWMSYTIDSTTFVAEEMSNSGGYTAIAIDSIGKIHISYRGDTHLRYATNR